MFVIKTKKLNVMGGFWMMKENRQEGTKSTEKFKTLGNQN